MGGQRGPKPLPANVHLLHGNPSKKTAFDLHVEFQPEVELPDCPPWLWPEAKKEWKRLGPVLVENGLISKVDRAAFTLYCQTWSMYVWATKRMTAAMNAAEKARQSAEEKGEVWSGGDGFQIPTSNGNFTYSPYWVAANKASDQVDKFLQSFGLSPSSRARVSVSNNRQAELFGRDGAPAQSEATEPKVKDPWNEL